MIRPKTAFTTSGTPAGPSDAQLLSCFAQTRDAAGERAFRELLDRHGPMVLGVCRQILRHAHDADDAFQATFLVLVRSAPRIQPHASLAPWLYGVAYRTAIRARAIALRYRTGVEPPLADQGVPPEDACTIDLRPLLIEELGKLPEKYRTPIVLCHLEGKTHEEAARLLSWPVGTVSGRLSRGRQLLRARLQRRGIEAPSAAFSAAWLLGAGAPPLTTSPPTLAALAAQSVSAPVLSLTHGVLRTMLFRKLGTIAAALVLVGVISGGVWAHMSSAPARQLRAPGNPPASRVIPAPPSPSQPSADAEAQLAQNCPTECPLTAGDNDNPRPYCPISMAAHAIKGVIGYFQR
jgi:RNA polymerase sigma factor (sigma-70 family)